MKIHFRCKEAEMDFKNLAETLMKFHDELKQNGATEEFAAAMCGTLITVIVNSLLAVHKQ